MQQKLAFCTKCGSEIKGKFCSKCGYQVHTDIIEHVNENDKEHVINTVSTNENQQNIKTDLQKNNLHIDNPLNESLPVIKPLEQPQKSKGIGKGCLISFLILAGFLIVVGVVSSFVFRSIIQNFFDGIFGNIPSVIKNKWSSKISSL